MMNTGKETARPWKWDNEKGNPSSTPEIRNIDGEVIGVCWPGEVSLEVAESNAHIMR